MNSNESFQLDNTLQLDVTHISMLSPRNGLPKGKHKTCFGTDNYGEFLKPKRSVVCIMNDDLCCARAIVVAKAIADKDERLKLIKDSRGRVQETLARKLQEESCVPLGPCGLDQKKLFEIVLSDYQFVVISAEDGHAIVHKGPPSEKQIMLLMHDGHFDVITKLPGFFNSSYFCHECEKAYSDEDYKNHPCHRTKCDSSLQRGYPDYIFKHIENQELPCKDCNRKFYGVTCQLNHLTQKANGQSVAPAESNVCQPHKKCPICLHVYTSTSQKHVKHCGLQCCSHCSKEVNILQHKCFLQPIDDDDNDKKKTIFMYFDIEVRQDTGNHIANLLCLYR